MTSTFIGRIIMYVPPAENEASTAATHAPPQPVSLVWPPFPLDNEPHGSRKPLGRVRYPRGQTEDVALRNGNAASDTVLHGFQHHVALQLVEQLLLLGDAHSRQ